MSVVIQWLSISKKYIEKSMYKDNCLSLSTNNKIQSLDFNVSFWKRPSQGAWIDWLLYEEKSYETLLSKRKGDQLLFIFSVMIKTSQSNANKIGKSFM